MPQSRDPTSFSYDTIGSVISHEYRCIFIHIPRTAGTAIERWICGRDWWYIEPSTKHLVASQARRLYEEYWDGYFKFSLVPNPWDRMVSCLQFADYFGLRTLPRHDGDGEYLDISGYERLFGVPLTLEYDYRFATREEVLLPSHRPHTVYGNILDEELDYVGRFEDLPAVVEYLRDRLGVPKPFPFEERPMRSTSAKDSLTLYTEEVYEGWACSSRRTWIVLAMSPDRRLPVLDQGSDTSAPGHAL